MFPHLCLLLAFRSDQGMLKGQLFFYEGNLDGFSHHGAGSSLEADDLRYKMWVWGQNTGYLLQGEQP